MELLEQFKTYLLQGKDVPNKITIKNYVADVRKFIRWFETRFMRPFAPRFVTKEIVDDFKKQLLSHNSQSQVASASSLKRYLSSLRKFYQFLFEQHLVEANPFALTAEQAIQPKDTWHLKEFKNFLFLSKASKPTIKNYLVDIKQFIVWFEQVTMHLKPSQSTTNAFEKIDGTLIEEYKSRLLYDATFEARSVNRKLSSLRKYLTWLTSQGFLKQQLTFNQVPIPSLAATEPNQTQTETTEVSLESLQTEIEPQKEKSTSSYSSFPPLRMLQKLSKGSNTLFDLLILWPVVQLVVATKYLIWKKSGAEVFAPLETMIKKPEIHDQRPVLEVTSVLDTFVTNSHKPGFGDVANLPKSLYAPVFLSIKDFPIHKKLVHHLRHTRPAWYKKYHSYKIVHYLHFGVALIYTSALGFMIYQAVVEAPRFSAPVLASLPGSPPRMLAFEGTLTDETNTPITAEQTLRFGLYDSPTASGSALLWQETQEVQPDNNGNFQTLLGKSQPIYQRLLNDNPRLFLGISIGPKQELHPRQQIATVTYSQDAEKLQGLAPITQPDAGTENVILALDSAGNMIIGGKASPRFEATGGQFILAGKTLTLTTTERSNSNIQLVPDGSGIIDIQKPIQNTTNYNNIQGVSGAVEFDDSVAILATTSGQSAFYINQNSTGDLISASSSGIAKFTLDYAGRGTFASDLAVNGNNLTTTSTNFNLVNKNVINLNIGGGATNISVGSTSGQTIISNKLVANNGLILPNGKELILEGFAKGAIPFLGGNKQLTQDSDNFVWAQDSKRFGLGTNAPLYRLDVRDSHNTGGIAQFHNTDNGSEADGIVVKVGTTTPGTSNSFITFQNGNGTVLGKITGGGLNPGETVRYNTTGADYAEYYRKADSTEHFEQGDIVCITANNGVSKCTGGQNILGVISNTAGFVGAGNHDNDPNYVLVGIVGQLPVKVASGSTTLTSGDALTIGANGVTKATKPCVIIGRALQSYNPQTDSMVSVALNIGWYDPTLAVNDTGNVLNQPELQDNPSVLSSIIDNINVGMNEANKNIIIGSLTLREYVTQIAKETTRELENQFFTRKLISPIGEIAHVKTNIISPLSDEGAIALQFNQSRLEIINPKGASTSAVASIDNEGNASFSGTLRARRIIADEIQGLNIQTSTGSANYITNVTNIYNVASTSSAIQTGEATQLSQQTQSAEFLDANEIATNFPTPNLNAEFAKFNQGLIALGGSSFTDVGITGTLRVGASMRISDTSINTIGTELALQPLRQGNLSLMGGLVTIDTEGNANFSKDVTVHGKFAANVIVPVPDQDLLMQLPTNDTGKTSKFEIQTGSGSAALTVNQYGDVIASGSGNFDNIQAKAFTIIRGVQADTSLTQTVAEGSGGTAVITANERERTIITPFIKPNSLIYVTPTSQTYGVTPYIARQTTNSFTIQIPYAVTKDIKLNWWIVN